MRNSDNIVGRSTSDKAGKGDIPVLRIRESCLDPALLCLSYKILFSGTVAAGIPGSICLQYT